MTHSPHGSRTGSLQCCKLPSEWVVLGNRAVKELQMRKPRHCPSPSLEDRRQLLQGAQPAQPSAVLASASASSLPTSMLLHGMSHRLCTSRLFKAGAQAYLQRVLCDSEALEEGARSSRACPRAHPRRHDACRKRRL